MKKLLTLTLFINLINFYGQQTFINKEWTEITGEVSTIKRTVSALDNNKDLIVVSNKVNTSNNSDVFISKYNDEGVLIWQKTFNGSGNGDDYGVQLKVTSNNDIIIAATITENTGVSFGILKYKSNGSLIWSQTWSGNNGNNLNIPADIDIDSFGNIYVAGGTSNNNGYSDYAIVKLTPNGSIVWDYLYDYSNLHDVATDIIIDGNNVVISGTSASSITSWDFATLKLNNLNGHLINSKRTSVSGVGLDNAVAVSMDHNNNTYVTGYIEDNGNKNIQTVKLDVNFNLVWVKNFDGGLDDVAKDLGIDDFGNIYIIGTKENQYGGKDYLTIKYDANGNEIWKKEFGSEGNDYTSQSEDIVIDNNNDVIITGYVDKSGDKKFATIKYSKNGELKFIEEFDSGEHNNEAKSIISDGDNIYVSGTSEVNGVLKNTTVKYSSKTKPIIVGIDNNNNKYVKNELIIKFDSRVINKTVIDNKDFTSGILSEFVNQDVLDRLYDKTGFYWNNLETYKVFTRLTTTDSISIDRLGNVVKVNDFWSTLSVLIPLDADELGVSNLLTDLDGVKYSERNMIGELMSTPNDDLYTTEQISGLSGGSGQGINVSTAWNKQVGQNYTKVGVFDTGINWRHEDFGDGTSQGSKITNGWDFYDNTNQFSQTTPDEHGHGTACAGIIGALRNNNLGMAGIAGGDVDENNTGVQIFDLKISGTVDATYVLHSVISAAIVEGALENPNTGFGYGLHIQNHSWGGPYSKTLDDAVNTCYQNSCVFIVSSGNTYSDDIKYPASFNDNWVLKVGASDIDGSRADFSTYGNNLDFIAPGVHDLYTTLQASNNSGYVDFFDNGNAIDGTSFSAPMVAGASALLYSEHNPNNNQLYPNNLATEDIEVMLQSFITDIISTGVGYDQQTGHGRVDAGFALQKSSLPYRIRHFEHTVNTSSATLYASNQTISFPQGVPGTSLAIGHYIGSTDVYQLNTTVSHSIPNTENYLSGWVRNSRCDLFPLTSTIDNPYWAGVTLNTSNQNSANLTGYIYRAKIYNSLGQHVRDEWIPTNLNSTVKMAYSIYTIDDNPSVSINEYNESSTYVYPNPTSNNVHFNYNLKNRTSVSFVISDIAGKIVLSHKTEEKEPGNYKETFNISKFANGLYNCKVIIGDAIHLEKIMKN